MVTTEDRVVLEACSQLSVEAGLVVADSALHMGRVSDQDLEERALRCREWPGSRGARLAIWLSDGRAETVGETRSRYLFWRFALPAPTLQYEVRDSSGLLVGRTDFAWEAYAHLGEFDGRLKYMRDAQPNEDPGVVVFREKKREDALRSENLGMSRLVWADLDGRGRRAATARRFERGLEESRRLFRRDRVVVT